MNVQIQVPLEPGELPLSTPSVTQISFLTRFMIAQIPLIRKRVLKSGLLTLVCPVMITLVIFEVFMHFCGPELEEDGIRIALTVVDTPGFGDNINNEAAWVSSTLTACAYSLLSSFQEIMAYLERQYDDILAEQSRIKRNPRFKDNRVHALLYFIPPTGHAYASTSAILTCRFPYSHIDLIGFGRWI